MKTNNKKSTLEMNKSATNAELDAANSYELRKLEFHLWLQEYQIVHNQILRRMEADEKGYESLIITISATVAASSLVINYKAYFLLLILSLPFHVLLWDQVKRGITGYILGEYATEVIAPKLDSIVGTTGSRTSKTSDKFIGWENYVAPRKSKRIIRFIRLLPKSGRTALQFSASLVLVILYLVFRRSDPQYISTEIDSLLVAINLFVIILSLFAVSTRLVRIVKRNS